MGALYTSRMLRFWNALLLCLALAGMPLQVLSAVTMAWCGHEGGHALTHQAPDSHTEHGDSHSPGDPTLPAGEACKDCSQCHLCSAHALPGVSSVTPALAASVHVARLAHQSGGFVPDQPKRPPLA